MGIAFAVVAVGACGGDDGGSSADPPADDTTTAPTAPPSDEAFEEGSCPSGTDDAVEVRCGTVTVPIDHDDPDAGTIQLAVGIVAASDGASDATPIFLLGGGPGEHTLEPLLEALTPDAPLLELAADRDLVIVDQRGAGASEPALECPDLQDSLAEVTEVAEVAAAAVEGVTRCRQRLVDEGVDLSAFHTAAAVADLDLVRQALDHDRVSLFGTSYGARLALQAARQHPDTIESVALSSPIPAEANFVVDAADSLDRAVAAVGDACAADPTCAAAHPDVTATAQRLVADLADDPLTVTVTDPASGETVEAPVDGAALATILFGLLYLPEGAAILPYLVTTLDGGDLSPLEEVGDLPTIEIVSQGQQLSFLCAEEAAVAGPDELTTGDLGIGSTLTEVNPVVGRTLWDLCEVWDVEPAGGDLFEPIATDVPLLVVTGQFDQITPPAYGEAVAVAAGTAWYVELAGVGHAPLLAAGPCGLALLAAFVAAPDQEPDPPCAFEDPGFLTAEDVAALSGDDEATDDD